MDKSQDNVTGVTIGSGTDMKGYDVDLRSPMMVKLDELSSKIDLLGSKFFPDFDSIVKWLGDEGIQVQVAKSDPTSPGIYFTMYDTPNWMPMKLEKMERGENEDKLNAINASLAQRFIISQEAKKSCIRVIAKFPLCRVELLSKLSMGPSEIIQVCLSKGANVGIKDDIIVEEGKPVQIFTVTIRDFFTVDNLTREVVLKTLSNMLLVKRLILNIAYPEE